MVRVTDTPGGMRLMENPRAVTRTAGEVITTIMESFR